MPNPRRREKRCESLGADWSGSVLPVGSRRAQRQWSSKEFLDRIIVSLNIFADGYLKIRTVLERSLDEVFLNRVAVAKVTAAARATTIDKPVMVIPKEDRWFLLNFVLNAV